MADRTITVWVTRFPDRATFQLQWIDPVTGQRKTKSSGVRDTGKARDRKDADAKARELEQLLRRGVAAIPSELSWESFRERYEKEHVPSLAKDTAAKVATIANYVEKFIDPRRLADVTGEQISRLAARLREEKKSESTIKSYLGQLKAMLRWGVAQKLLPECPPIPTIRRAKKSGGTTPMKGRPITGEEFERMLKVTPDVVGPEAAPAWRHYLRGLWVSGLRLRESLELYWDREDKIQPILPKPGKGLPVLRVLAELEKGHSDRLLPIAPEFAVFLLETPESDRTGRVFKLPKEKRRTIEARADWAGRVISSIGKKAGVIVRTDPADPEKKKYASAHDLRRAFGTRWAERVMPAVLQALMRHEAIETTLRYYVGANAERTAETCWAAIPGARGSYAAAFGEYDNGLRNTPPAAIPSEP
ncbi:MAG: tyrosine-type recombinase/integrase [Planctomycetia bacterium]